MFVCSSAEQKHIIDPESDRNLQDFVSSDYMSRPNSSPSVDPPAKTMKWLTRALAFK